MAPSYPLSVDSFIDTLPLRSLTMHLSENMQFSETGGGQILTAASGARLWVGSVKVRKLLHHDARRLTGLINALQQPGRSFMVYDTKRALPLEDQEGQITSVKRPKISGIGENRARLTLEDCQTGYILSPGDHLAFKYGSNPTRYALHEVVEGNSANRRGNMGWIYVAPFIRPGASVGTPVELHKPACKAIYDPGSFEPGTREGALTDGFSFRFKQTLR